MPETTTTPPDEVFLVPYDPQVTQMERHPLSRVWGDIPRDAMFNDFRKSVEKSGVREPILIYEDKVLDGFHRYQTSLALGIPCPARKFTGSLEDAAEVSLAGNLHRRHLSAGQIAEAVVATYEHLLPKHGGDRKSATAAKELRLTAKRLADRYGVSENTIRRARAKLRPPPKDEASEPKAPTPEAPTPKGAKTPKKAAKETEAAAPKAEPAPKKKAAKAAPKTPAAEPEQEPESAPEPPDAHAPRVEELEAALDAARARIADLEEALRAARQERERENTARTTAERECSRLTAENERLKRQLKALPPPPKDAEVKRPTMPSLPTAPETPPA